MPAKHALRNTALAAALCTAAAAALAQTPAPALAEPPKVEPDWTFATNVGIFSQYVFRGIQQTNDKPALQGGFDLSHKSGFYVGTWLSNVSWISDNAPDVSASLEWDMYGGYTWDLGNDPTWDYGGLNY